MIPEIDPQSVLKAMREVGMNPTHIEDTFDYVTAFIDHWIDMRMSGTTPSTNDEMLNPAYISDLYKQAAYRVLDERQQVVDAAVKKLDDDYLRDNPSWFLALIKRGDPNEKVLYGLALGREPLKDCNLDAFITLAARLAELHGWWKEFYDWKDYFYDIDFQQDEVEMYKITGEIFNLLIQGGAAAVEARVASNAKDLAERLVMEKTMEELKNNIKKSDKELSHALQAFITSASEHYQLSLELEQLADKAASDHRYYQPDPAPVRFIGVEYQTTLPGFIKNLVDGYFMQRASSTDEQDAGSLVKAVPTEKLLKQDGVDFDDTNDPV